MAEHTASKVPQIRFKGFEDGWREDQLRERVEFFSGLTYSPRNVQKGVGTLVLRSSNVKNGEIVDADNVYVDPNIVNSKNVEVGDIAVVVRNGSRSLIGKHAQIKSRMDSTVIGAFMTGIHSENPEFTNALLDTPQFDKEIAKNLGATINQITTGAFKQMMFRFPRCTEQTKIGEYFRELDRLIGLHQRKHDKLVMMKKAMLQKMFPQPGATTPEIRFKEFSGEWVEMKLHSLADRYDNLRVPVSASNRIPGNTPYYGANGIQDYVEGYTHEGEFILVAEDGANDLKNYPVQYVSGKVWVNNHAHVLQGMEGLADTRFLKYAFSQVNIEVFLVGGGRSKLNAETMMQLELCVPTVFAEQQKIGAYFRTLDELISQHATQLQKLQQIKSACLEKMFV